jgi:hypothetical protein
MLISRLGDDRIEKQATNKSPEVVLNLFASASSSL